MSKKERAARTFGAGVPGVAVSVQYKGIVVPGPEEFTAVTILEELDSVPTIEFVPFTPPVISGSIQMKVEPGAMKSFRAAILATATVPAHKIPVRSTSLKFEYLQTLAYGLSGTPKRTEHTEHKLTLKKPGRFNKKKRTG